MSPTHYIDEAFARLRYLEEENRRLREFYNAQKAFELEDEDADLRAWNEARQRLEAARSALEAK